MAKKSSRSSKPGKSGKAILTSAQKSEEARAQTLKIGTHTITYSAQQKGRIAYVKQLAREATQGVPFEESMRLRERDRLTYPKLTQQEKKVLQTTYERGPGKTIAEKVKSGQITALQGVMLLRRNLKTTRSKEREVAGYFETLQIKADQNREKTHHENGTPRGEIKIRRAGMVLKYDQKTAKQGEAVKKALTLTRHGVAPNKITQHHKLKGIQFTKEEMSVIDREFRMGPGAIIFQKLKEGKTSFLQAEQELLVKFKEKIDPFVLQSMLEEYQEHHGELRRARKIEEGLRLRKSEPLVTRITEQVRQGKINKHEAIEYLDISSIPVDPRIKNALDRAGKEAQGTKNAIQEVKLGIELGTISSENQANKVFQEKGVLAPTRFLSEIKTELRRTRKQHAKARQEVLRESQREKDRQKIKELEARKSVRKPQITARTDPKQEPKPRPKRYASRRKIIKDIKKMYPPKKKKSLLSRILGK